jgi:hypothetical protein
MVLVKIEIRRNTMPTLGPQQEKTEKQKPRPVKEILKRLASGSKDLGFYIEGLLPAINTDAIANIDQEKWIEKQLCDRHGVGTGYYAFISAINNFRG